MFLFVFFQDDDLKKLAQGVLELIKQTIGIEEFTFNLAKSSKRRLEIKEDRKRKLAQTVGSNIYLI